MIIRCIQKNASKYFVNDAQKRNDWQYTKTKHNYKMSYRHQWQHFKTN